MRERKNWGRIAGLVLHILVGGLMIFTGSEKVLGLVPPQALATYGLGEQMRLIGAGAIVTAFLLLIPRTSSLGILLTSSFWGGAICIHMAYCEPTLCKRCCLGCRGPARTCAIPPHSAAFRARRQRRVRRRSYRNRSCRERARGCTSARSSATRGWCLPSGGMQLQADQHF